jgi:hypothetical protein
MEVLKPTADRPIDESNDSIDTAEMQRLGLHKQYKQYVTNRRPPEGEPEIYLFGVGEMLIELDGGMVYLDRADVVKLYTFFDQPEVEKMMIAVLRASLIESGQGELVDALIALPAEHQQAILWAFGRAERPAILDTPPAA